MRSKNFISNMEKTTGVGALVGGGKAPEEKPKREPNAPTSKGRKRQTFLIDQDLLDKLRSLAEIKTAMETMEALQSGKTTQRTTQTDIIEQALLDYFNKWEKKNGEIGIIT